MNIKRKRSKEKLEMSFKEFAIVYRRSFSLFQDRASLKTRMSRKVRNVEMTPLPCLMLSDGSP